MDLFCRETQPHAVNGRHLLADDNLVFFSPWAVTASCLYEGVLKSLRGFSRSSIFGAEPI